MILELYAKVIFQSEEDMEAKQIYDLGSIAKSKEFVWSNIGIRVETVDKIVAYSKSKCVIYTTDDGKEDEILVAEKFEDVMRKWKVALYEYNNSVNTEANEEVEKQKPQEEDDDGEE